MKVLVLYNETGLNATIEDQDVLAQRDSVAAALTSHGHDVASYGCTLDLQPFQDLLQVNRPDAVFNLVEALGGTDRLMAVPLLLLDAQGIPYTGAPAHAVLETSDKLRAKRKLIANDLPTPGWVDSGQTVATAAVAPGGRWILKPVGEHASVGMDDDSVVQVESISQLQVLCLQRSQEQRRLLFAEQFIDGREFNLSMLAGEVLPPAEIDFSTFPLGKPRIVGHKAKWDQDSFEYLQTPRTFDFPENDGSLLERLSQLAQRCWDLFGFRGFARVDFRVDSQGKPWILEVNVNPCLSPDAGFAAALDKAGIAFEDAIERIVWDAEVPIISAHVRGR